MFASETTTAQKTLGRGFVAPVLDAATAPSQSKRNKDEHKAHENRPVFNDKIDHFYSSPDGNDMGVAPRDFKVSLNALQQEGPLTC